MTAAPDFRGGCRAYAWSPELAAGLGVVPVNLIDSACPSLAAEALNGDRHLASRRARGFTPCTSRPPSGLPRRMLPFLFILYIANFLDRTSVAYAAIGMSRDLGFSDRVFGLGVGVFFIGYLALQIPGALLVERWSARKTIASSMVAWGSFTALTALVHTPMELYGAQFLLGVAEASFFPGVVVYLSQIGSFARIRARSV